jgi:hypothetical protein
METFVVQKVKREIRGLTVWQPHAWAIAYAGKDHENRTWRPPSNMIGHFLAIHAGKRVDGEGLEYLRLHHGIVPPAGSLVTGAIIAVARLVGWTEFSPSRWFVGPIGWQLTDVVVLPKPVPCDGRQKLWELDGDMLHQVRLGWMLAKD